MLGYPHGLSYSFASHPSKNPPSPVIRRIFEILAHLIKNNPLVADVMAKQMADLMTEQTKVKLFYVYVFIITVY